MSDKQNIIKKIFLFYIDGFKNLSGWGKQLWLIILIKLFIMFAIFRLLFFPDFLKTNFKTDRERSNYVIEQLTEPNNTN